ncbi:MAG: hypothetical protein ACRDST_00375 [Pseudonocardiaceae bacterium]
MALATASSAASRSAAEWIRVVGAREHNLANIDVDVAVADAGSQIAAVLDQNPLRGTGPYPAEVHRQLAEDHAALQRAVQAYPLALAMDTAGRPDKLGAELAGLMGYVQHVLVLYHNLADVPDHMRAQAPAIFRRLTSGPVMFAIDDVEAEFLA